MIYNAPYGNVVGIRKWTVYVACIYLYVTHWDWVIGSVNGLSHKWRQVITWANAESLSIGPLGTNFCEIGVKMRRIPFRNMHLEIPSAKWWPFRLAPNVLTERVSYLSSRYLRYNSISPRQQHSAFNQPRSAAVPFKHHHPHINASNHMTIAIPEKAYLIWNQDNPAPPERLRGWKHLRCHGNQ